MAKREDGIIENEVLEQDVDTAAVEAEKLEAFKQSKREAAQRFKEKRAAEKAERIEKTKALIERGKSAGWYDTLDDDLKDWLSKMANPVAAHTATAGGAGNSSIFNKLFGDTPNVGDSVTLREAFEKTMKGKTQIDAYTKKWAKSGTVVSFKQNVDNIFESTYVIEAIGTGTVEADAE